MFGGQGLGLREMYLFLFASNLCHQADVVEFPSWVRICAHVHEYLLIHVIQDRAYPVLNLTYVAS